MKRALTRNDIFTLTSIRTNGTDTVRLATANNSTELLTSRQMDTEHNDVRNNINANMKNFVTSSCNPGERQIIAVTDIVVTFFK